MRGELPSSRNAASRLGISRYFSGKPCKRAGHLSQRQTSSGVCIACRRQFYAPVANAKRTCRLAELERARTKASATKKHKRVEEAARLSSLFPDRRIASRSEATILGLARYFTGHSCRRGHFAERRTKDGVCSACPQRRGCPAKIKKAKLREYKKHKAAYFARASARRAAKQHPSWADRGALLAIIVACPSGHHVDHVVPLKGEFVSGLHVPWNLQYLPSVENLRKGNKWPYTPFGGKPLPHLDVRPRE